MPKWGTSWALVQGVGWHLRAGKDWGWVHMSVHMNVMTLLVGGAYIRVSEFLSIVWMQP